MPHPITVTREYLDLSTLSSGTRAVLGGGREGGRGEGGREGGREGDTRHFKTKANCEII